MGTPAQAARAGATPLISCGGNFGFIVKFDKGVRQVVKGIVD